MANQYVNKVQKSDGTPIIDITDTTATAADVATGKYFYAGSGEKTEGLNAGGNAFLISDTTDTAGGTIRTATAIEVTGTKSITDNGTYDVTSFASADVSVPASAVDTGTKSISISSNGTTTHDIVGYASASITANVPNSYSASDEGKVVDNGALVSQTSATYTSNDTYDTTLIDEVTVNVSGGGTTEPESLDVDFIDYDGTLLYSYTAADFLNLTEMPANPSHTGLVAQGWNWTLADAKEHVEEYTYLVIGQNYTTDTGDTRVYVTYDEASAKCRQFIKYYGTVKGGVTVDWGDGTIVTPTTNENALTSITHTYGTPGSYVIKITVNDGTIKIGYNGSNSGFLFEPTSDAYFTRDAIRKIEIGDNVTQSYRAAFANLTRLQSMSIPKDFMVLDSSVSNGAGAFQYCTSLHGIVLSRSTITIPNMCFRYCGLKYISIPKETTTIGSSAFGYTYFKKLTISNASTIGQSLAAYIFSLQNVVIGGNYTEIPTYAVQNCNKIDNSIIIPNTVTSITASAFANTYVDEYHLRSTTPPTLANKNAFYNATYMKFYVPYSDDHSILAAYQAASNWSTFASKIVEEPQ